MHLWQLWLWLFFILGQSAHVLKRAEMSASSNVSQGNTKREWFARNWSAVLRRFFYCNLFFMVWLGSGNGDTTFGHILDVAGGSVLTKYLPVPNQLSLVILAAAGAFGLAADSAIDFLQAKFAPSTQKETSAL